MTIKQDIYLDIGDIYTKLLIFYNNELKYDICFPTVFKKGEITNKTACYIKDADTDNYYTVGWEAAEKSSYENVVSLRSKANLLEVINKILFNYIENRSKITVHIVDNEPGDDEFYDDFLEPYIVESGYFVSGFINNVFVDKEYLLTFKRYHLSDILKNYYSEKDNSFGHDFIAVLDIGFKKAKVILIDNKNDHITLKILNHGFDYILKKISENFLDIDIRLNPFLVLKELEWGNTVVNTEKGTFDVDNILKNAKFDLNTLITSEIDEVLKSHYNTYLSWPNFLYITGGGAVLNGDAVKRGLSSKYSEFKKTLIDENPRAYLLRVWLNKC